MPELVEAYVPQTVLLQKNREVLRHIVGSVQSAYTRVVIACAEIQRAADFVIVFSAVPERVGVEVVDVLFLRSSM